MSKKIKAVLFDCDGVLVDSEPLHEQAVVEELAKYGLVYTDAQKKAFVGRSEDDNWRIIHADYRRDFGKELSTACRDDARAHYLLLEQQYLRATEGVREVLQLLVDHGIPIAVGSNSAQGNVVRKLKITGLDYFFGVHMYGSDQVAQGKPAPDIYHFAARQLGCTAEQAIVIDDSISGVTAGRHAKSHVIGYTGACPVDCRGRQNLFNAGAQAVVNHMQEIGVNLRALLGIGILPQELARKNFSLPVLALS